MNTPICDFVNEYIKKNTARFHMPGHKGKFEKRDITEIDGADELFLASGIIARSEKNASEVFEAETFYSCAGSTLSIQAMLYLIALYAEEKGIENRVLAGRNAHKAFVSAAALCNTRVSWLFPESGSYISCNITPENVKKAIDETSPAAMYVTSPDYLGNILDIKGIARVCKECGVLLAVDCAHGAYLKFFGAFPTDLGADMCASSAHKTLPVLTGGAYLHIRDNAFLSHNAKRAMALFASSSPSYLILQSLDAFNPNAESFKKRAKETAERVKELKQTLKNHGYSLIGDEPLKITVLPKSIGYTGADFAKMLEDNGVYPEFYDSDAVVFMASPENSESDFIKLETALTGIKAKEKINSLPPVLPKSTQKLTFRQAVFSKSETVKTAEAAGRICADALVSCPPAIPIAVPGEVIGENTVKCLEYYGKTEIRVIK